MMIYEKEYELRISDFDSSDQLKSTAVLDIFQSMADKHAHVLNIGFDDLIKKDLVWVLLRSRFDIISPIRFGTDTVIAKTWPHKAGRVDFDRDYLVEDLNGNVLVKGSSKWCVINYKTRRIAINGGVAYPDGEYYPLANYQDGLKKLPDFDISGAEKFTGYAGDSTLDHNGHVNNVEYCRFIIDALKLAKDEKIKFIELNYINEMQVGEYELYFKKEGNNRLIRGFSQGKESFRAVVGLF